MDVKPKITHLRDIDCSKLKFVDGRASFRPVVYENENCYVHIPKSAVVSIDEFRNDKGTSKYYLSLNVTEFAEMFDGLSQWLSGLGTQTHPITKDNYGSIILKMKIPTPDDNASRPGIFDDDSKPIHLKSVRQGCEVETIAHLGNVWNMRGTTGLTVTAVQIKTYSRVANCLITDVEEDEDDASALMSDSRCMIVG